MVVSYKTTKFSKRFLRGLWDTINLVSLFMSVEHINNIYDLIIEERKNYDRPVTLEDGWDWGMKEHLRKSFLYLNSQFSQDNEDKDLRPNKNIVLPIMNVQYRTEGFDVKDIEIYVDNPDEYYKSLLVRKFHQKWALENDIDTFIDEMVFSYSTYGGVLVRQTDEAKPEVIDLRTLAFCNQTDLMNYPFAIKHEYSFSQLRTANKKWGDGNYGATIGIEELITIVKKEGKKTVEVFEVHGLMPKEWLTGEDDSSYDLDDDAKDVNQMQVVAFYQNENKQSRGVTLFRYREPKLPFKFLARDRVEGRALGRGGVEELFDPQIWTNWNEIKVAEMLDAASKTISWTTDPSLKGKNNLNNVDNNEVLILQDGKTIQQLDTYPRNLAVFNDALGRWQEHAQILGSATDPLLGETPNSGTPFKLYEAQQMESKSMHRFRQGQLAVFMDEIYRDWLLPHLAREIAKEQNFMAELSVDEMAEVVDKVMIKKANEFKKRMILSLQEVNEELVNDYKQVVGNELIKKSNKKFFKILKDEMKEKTLKVMTNIAGKQKNLALLTDKLVNVLRQYLSTPQLRQDPEMTKLLNAVLESSGLSPIMFGSSPVMQAAQPMMGAPGQSTQPLQQLGQQQVNQQQV